jgi:hypothetical protein
MQPAGRYTVETDDESLPTLLSSAHRRIATWIALPAQSGSSQFVQLIRIDPVELDAALARDAAIARSSATEAKPDDLRAQDSTHAAERGASPARAGSKTSLRDLTDRLVRMWRPPLR